MNRDTIPYYRPVLLVIYGTGVTSGAGFLINQSPTLSRALDARGYVAWAALFIFGGIVGLVSVARKWKPLEAVALISLGGGVLVIVVAILFSQPLREQDGVNIGMAGLLSVTLLLMILRGLVLHQQIRIRDQAAEGIIHDHQ